jgi:hypothetical protein
MTFPVDMKNPWFHGSPEIMDTLREGSTITQWRELAEAFAAKPERLEYDTIFGKITHTGTRQGFLYVIDEPLEMDADIYPHPRSTMDPGVEYLTRKPLKIKQYGGQVMKGFTNC